MQRVFTIGYEGASLDDFIATLQLADIDVLLDVRELPISRRKGFSKTALGQALAQAGIAYQHEKRLGSPSPIRRRLHEDGDYSVFFRDFRCHLEAQSALLAQLAEDVTGNVALMCFERDPTTCHRSVVAEALEALLDVSPKHLGVKRHASKQESNASRAHLGQGVPAA